MKTFAARNFPLFSNNNYAALDLTRNVFYMFPSKHEKNSFAISYLDSCQTPLRTEFVFCTRPNCCVNELGTMGLVHILLTFEILNTGGGGGEREGGSSMETET